MDRFQTIPRFVGGIVDIKIDDGTTYYVVDSGNKNINWFTSEELQETE